MGTPGVKRTPELFGLDRRRSPRAWHAVRDGCETWEALHAPDVGVYPDAERTLGAERRIRHGQVGRPPDGRRAEGGQGVRLTRSTRSAGDPCTRARLPAGMGKGLALLRAGGKATCGKIARNTMCKPCLLA